ncbi:hypothetical protein LPJ81_002896 [Coemansia sp. IMI 209127]|nr:hypothetical protein LPJ81_002896 [Coemansia sp. IMI 209127]
MGVCGISWAVAIWVPFSLLGEIISSGHAGLGVDAHDDGNYRPVASDGDGDGVDAIPMERIEQNGRDSASCNSDEDMSSSRLEEAQGIAEPMSAGTVLGLHNVFVVVPQFITALASSLIFALFEHVERNSQPSSAGGQHAMEIAIVLCLGGTSSAVAAYRAWKLSSH